MSETYPKTLIGLLLVGTPAAVIAAIIDIEAIVVTGPVMSVVGVAVASVSFQRRAPLGFYYGLSFPTISVVCFCLIYGLGWGPARATVPIGALVTFFGIGSTALAIPAFRESRRNHKPPQHGRLQFGIGTLLVAMFAIALPLGLHQTAGPAGGAIGILISYAITAGACIRRFHASRLAARMKPQLTGGE